MTVRPPSDATWRTAQASSGGQCVEVTDTAADVWVRDSKDRQGPVLHFTRPEWTAFLAGVRNGEFEGPLD
jgi:hypothetical protein